MIAESELKVEYIRRMNLDVDGFDGGDENEDDDLAPSLARAVVVTTGNERRISRDHLRRRHWQREKLKH